MTLVALGQREGGRPGLDDDRRVPLGEPDHGVRFNRPPIRPTPEDKRGGGGFDPSWKYEFAPISIITRAIKYYLGPTILYWVLHILII